MIQPNGQNGSGRAATIQEPAARETVIGTPAAGDALETGAGTCDKSQAAHQTAVPTEPVRDHRRRRDCGRSADLCCYVDAQQAFSSEIKERCGRHAGRDVESSTPGDKSLFPITDSGRPAIKETHEGFLNERDLQRTATGRPAPGTPRVGQGNTDGTLASIPPFGEQQNWQAPPYQPGTSVNNAADVLTQARRSVKRWKNPRWCMCAVFLRSKGNFRSEEISSDPGPDIGLGLATGTRLRARLESAASTAVRTPVLAVIEYNYERDGEIVVPAGARVVGHMQDGGPLRLRAHRVRLTDDARWCSHANPGRCHGSGNASAQGKSRGKNTGKNVLVRSLSGIGQVGATLVGRGNLNQPLSESDLVRERVSNNIGEAGDEQISRMAVTQHIVVTISADTPIYVVLEQTPKSNSGSDANQSCTVAQLADSPNAENLRQLLQLQRELNQPKNDQ